MTHVLRTTSQNKYIFFILFAILVYVGHKKREQEASITLRFKVGVDHAHVHGQES